MKSLRGQKIVIATHNPGKLREIADLLRPFDINVVSAAELGLSEPEETGVTLIENAEIKARAALAGSGLPALADDSGLTVNALNGAPGIYSARWAGPGRDFTMAMRRVWDEIGEIPDKSAAFVCVLALAFPGGAVQSFEGRVDGRLVWPPRGEKGFGYDPFFIADGQDMTFAEMEPQAKHAISHRAQAFARLTAAMNT